MQPSQTPSQFSSGPRGISRRRFLILSTLGAGLGAGLLSACGGQPSAPAQQQAPAQKPAESKPAESKPAAAATTAPAAPAAPQPTAKPVVTAAAAPPSGAATPAPAAAASKPVKKGGILKMGINQE